VPNCFSSGVLMDDAVILPCGHSFGSGGMQHVFRMVRLRKMLIKLSYYYFDYLGVMKMYVEEIRTIPICW